MCRSKAQPWDAIYYAESVYDVPSISWNMSVPLNHAESYWNKPAQQTSAALHIIGKSHIFVTYSNTKMSSLAVLNACNPTSPLVLANGLCAASEV